MQHHEGEVVGSLRRAKWFLVEHTGALGPFAESPASARLDELIRDMESNHSVQHGTVKESKAATVSKAELRRALRLEHMQPISAIARSRLAGIDTPKMAKFSVPNTSASDVALLAAGRAMSSAAAEYTQVFVDEKLPADFLEQLDAAVVALQDTIVARDGDKLQRRRATLGLRGQLLLARELFNILTGFVRKSFAKQPEVIGEWLTAIRIPAKTSVRRPVPVPIAAPVAAPTPTGNAVPGTSLVAVSCAATTPATGEEMKAV